MIPTRRSLPAASLLSITLFAACAGPSRAREESETRKEDETYTELVTDEAETDEGLFSIHRVEDKLLFEIPDELLGRDMLLVSRIARVPAGLAGGYFAAGHKTGEQVLRWERMDDRILLRKVSFQNVADEDEAIHHSVVNNNFFPILGAFDVAAEGPGDVTDEDEKTSVVIDVTSFFSKDVPAISGLTKTLRDAHKVRGLDKDRSFLNYARSYPQNVEVRHTFTFGSSAPPSDAAAQTLSFEMHQSMILLPEEPMRKRFADHRVGWFTIQRTNYGLDAQKAADEEFIARWRLEPSDPEAYARGELVEPVKPIVYYLDPGTPEKWRDAVKQGVEDWNAAFESAGFKNAIHAKDVPSPEEDPEFNGEDVRYSMVRWAASTTRNAMGPSVTDPRSGEIIESDIVWYHNHMRSYRNRLLLETGAANPMARSLPIDDELLGEALRQVIAHEVGHALGLPHNMMASSSYPTESLRDPEFASRMGVSASIMDYARQNYVAQPEDGLEAADFIRQIGPYDHYSIEWGYRVIPEAATAEDEKPVLDEWIAAKADDPMYRFGSRGGVDPRSQTEDLGDDPVASSGYGVANLKRVAPRLIEWTASAGEDYGDLSELYGELLGQYARYMGHVVTVIGGVHEDRKSTDQEGRVYTPVPVARQREALAFLGEHALATQDWLLDPEILRRTSNAGEVDRYGRLQRRFLDQLLEPARLQRMIEAGLESDSESWPLHEYLDEVRATVWADASSPYARALQRSHVARLEWLMTDEPSFTSTPVDLETSDIRALARWQLEQIAEDVEERAAAATEPAVAVHLADVAAGIREFFASLAAGG